MGTYTNRVAKMLLKPSKNGQREVNVINTQALQRPANIAELMANAAERAGFLILADHLNPTAQRAAEINTALVPGLLEHLNEYYAQMRTVDPTAEQITAKLPVRLMEVIGKKELLKVIDIVRRNIRLTKEQCERVRKNLTEHATVVAKIKDPATIAKLEALENDMYHQHVLRPANERTHPMRVYEQMQTQMAKVAGLTGKYNTFDKLQQCPELDFITPDALEWYLVQCKYHGLITAQWNPHKEHHNYRPTKKGKELHETHYGNRI